MSDSPRVLSLCSGVGGMDLGFESAGFSVVLHGETNPHASEILKARWPEAQNLGDWTTLAGHFSAEESQGIDLIIGGIPCTPHSVAGSGGGADDARNLWPPFIKMVDDIRPKVWVIENVPGILSSDGGQFFADLIADAQEAEYSVEWVVIGACHFGAPHKRLRVFVVGRRDGRQSFPKAIEHACIPGLIPISIPRAGRVTDGQWFVRKSPAVPSSPMVAQMGEWWPTTRAGDGKQGVSSWLKRLESGQSDVMLEDAVLMEHYRDASFWPTTSAMDGKRVGKELDIEHWKEAALRHAAKGVNKHYHLDIATHAECGPPNRLNPDWTEMLVGLPKSWTDTEVRAIERGVPSLNLFPMPMSAGELPAPQFPWEPPRLTDRKDQRNARLTETGNICVPAQARQIARHIKESLR